MNGGDHGDRCNNNHSSTSTTPTRMSSFSSYTDDRTITSVLVLSTNNDNVDEAIKSILAWKHMEEKHYFYHDELNNKKGYCSVSSSQSRQAAGGVDDTGMERHELDRYYKQRHREKLVGWCFRMIDYFQLPTYLVEWTMNFVDRYCVAQRRCSKKEMISTTKLKLMTATALRLTIKLDAGQSWYSSISLNTTKNGHHHHYYHGHDHLKAMMAIPTIMMQGLSMEDPNLNDINERNVQTILVPKLEMSLLTSLGFYVHPPLTERYIDEFEQVLLATSPAGNDGEANTLLKLQEVKQRAIMICQTILWKNVDFSCTTIPPSYMAFAAYLTALLQTQGTVSSYTDKKSASVAIQKQSQYYYLYKFLLETFKDILVLPKHSTIKLEDMIEDLKRLFPHQPKEDPVQDLLVPSFQNKNKQDEKDTYPPTHHYNTMHQRRSFHSNTANSSSSLLGKRKVSP